MDEISKKEELEHFDSIKFLNYLLNYIANSSIHEMTLQQGTFSFFVLKKRAFNYAYNLPYGLYSGNLSSIEIDAAMKAFSALNYSQLIFNVGPDVFIDKNEALKISSELGFDLTSYACHIIDTSKPIQDIFEGFNTTRKKHIKRYQKAGVLKVFRTKDPIYFKEYFKLYESSAKRWGSDTTYSAGLIEGLYQIPGIYMWVAEYNGEMLSGMICFYHKNTVFDWLAASIINEDVKKLYPAVAVQYEVIRHAAENGYTSVNMGASNNLNGVSDFKDSWGAIEKKTYTFIKRKGIFALIKKIRNKLKN